jgi:hypothetical protein
LEPAGTRPAVKYLDERNLEPEAGSQEFPKKRLGIVIAYQNKKMEHFL